jgi:hypothetical protein
MIELYLETGLVFCEICDNYTPHLEIEEDLECEYCLLSYE